MIKAHKASAAIRMLRTVCNGNLVVLKESNRDHSLLVAQYSEGGKWSKCYV